MRAMASQTAILDVLVRAGRTVGMTLRADRRRRLGAAMRLVTSDALRVAFRRGLRLVGMTRSTTDEVHAWRMRILMTTAARLMTLVVGDELRLVDVTRRACLRRSLRRVWLVAVRAGAMPGTCRAACLVRVTRPTGVGNLRLELVSGMAARAGRRTEMESGVGLRHPAC